MILCYPQTWITSSTCDYYLFTW